MSCPRLCPSFCPPPGQGLATCGQHSARDPGRRSEASPGAQGMGNARLGGPASMTSSRGRRVRRAYATDEYDMVPVLSTLMRRPGGRAQPVCVSSSASQG